MSQRIENIVIVGGGTSGWLSAVFLNAALSHNPQSPCQITLIESSDIGIIGVGEATIPSLKNTFMLCGIDERDWMIKCNSSFKLAIRYVNWLGRAPNDVFWHPFDRMPTINGLGMSHYWLQRRLRGDPEPFAYSCSPYAPVCDAKRGPKQGHEPQYQGTLQYAYHMDAGLVATYLKEIGKSRGVRHVVDNVVDVVLDERGFISHLRTEHSGDLHGDLFVDSSGFRGLLINQALGEPFLPYGDALLCDSAVAINIPTDDERNGINPYTSATALSAGWAWHIPLYGRSGNGYVYSRAHLSSDQAEDELRRHLGPTSHGIPARHIQMRVGRTRNAWVKNCVAIGLASGFIEPLESTGIWFVELALYNLIFNFPDKQFHPANIDKFNSLMRKNYEQVRDFLVLHYCTTCREDTLFWRANKYHRAIPSSLQANLELWNSMLPNHEQMEDLGFFKSLSYCSILAGMERLPSNSLPILDYRPKGEADSAFRNVKLEAERLCNTLPDLYHYLRWLRNGEPTNAR